MVAKLKALVPTNGHTQPGTLEHDYKLIFWATMFVLVLAVSLDVGNASGWFKADHQVDTVPVWRTFELFMVYTFGVGRGQPNKTNGKGERT
jgi:hypothetical protein